jgi:uncharacterized protein
MSYSLKQWQRFVVFGLNTVAFYALYRWATGSWKLTSGPETLWFGSAVAWWALSLLSAPFFRPPKDALGTGVAAFLTLVSTDLNATKFEGALLDTVRNFAVGYSLLVIVAAFVAALADQRTSFVARVSYLAAERLSSGAFLFGLLALISIFGFYEESEVVLVLTSVWLLFAIVRPFELLFNLVSEWNIQRSVTSDDAIGQILRVDDPDIVRISINSATEWMSGLYVACLPGDVHRFVLPLFSHIQDELIIGTGLITDTAPSEKLPHVLGLVFRKDDDVLKSSLVGQLCGSDDGSQIVGFVVEGSQISEVRFEVSGATGLKEGAVVFCCAGADRVYYQIMDARTAEESFQQNPRGTHIVSAAQLGTWNQNSGFQKFPWLPGMNRPVFAAPAAQLEDVQLAKGEFALGNVPGTSLTVKASLPEVISYHTAVLGITGTGKTELVLDLIR